MTKMKKKKIRFQLKLVSKAGGRGRDSITRVIRKLALVMRRKLKRLSSELWQPPAELIGARKLELIFTRNKYITKKAKFRQVSKRFTVARFCSKRKYSLSCNYWHELKRKEIEFMLVEACKKTGPNIQKMISMIGLRASQFNRIVSREVKLEKFFDKMEKYNVPFDPYKPLTEEQSRILQDLPLFRLPNQVPELMFPPKPLDPTRLRQTKISDYFNVMKASTSRR